jgi:hypothetical protein
MRCSGVWYKFTDVSEESAALILSHQNVGSAFLQNVCKHKPYYTASHPKRQHSLESPP